MAGVTAAYQTHNREPLGLELKTQHAHGVQGPRELERRGVRWLKDHILHLQPALVLLRCLSLQLELKLSSKQSQFVASILTKISTHL